MPPTKGNTRTDAQGDLLRGLQVVETAAGIPTALLGNTIEGASLAGPTTSMSHIFVVYSQQGYGYLCTAKPTRCMRKVSSLRVIKQLILTVTIMKCCTVQLPCVSVRYVTSYILLTLRTA